MIKISVIIPMYNSEKYIRECLNSVLSQTLTDIEIICINDGSSDNSINILNEYKQKDNRIVIIDRENKGASVSRNESINIAKGEFVCFMDSDDVYPTSDILETLYTKAKENNVLIAGGEFSVFDENIKPYEFKKKFGKSIDGYLFKNDGVIDYNDYQFDYGFHRFIYDREMLINNNIYFPKYTRLEDPIFFINAMHQAKKFYAVNKISYGYRSRPKEVKFTEQNTVDTLNAILEMLDFADENNYKKLEKYVAKRYIEHLGFIKDRTNEICILEDKVKENKCIKVLLKQEKTKKLLQNLFSIKNEVIDRKKVKVLKIMGVELYVR